MYEGHQEAVMWFSAINELLMFGFGMASLWCWMTARQARRDPEELPNEVELERQEAQAEDLRDEL